MKFVVEIDCDNAAFEAEEGDDVGRATEVARILEVAADKVRNMYESVTLYDINGNNVGLAAFTDK
jgi:hypothetical protein